MKGILWDKLVQVFPSPTFNGVKIPGLDLGETFEGTYPVRGEFPVEQFLPLIAVAYHQASSFSDPNAKLFSMKLLFAPKFGPNLSDKLLSVLKNKSSMFDRFDGVGYSGQPMDLLTNEVFSMDRYLPEIQYAFDLATSTQLTAGNFHPSDLYASLYPMALPSVKAFASFVKSKILKEVMSSLNNMFDVGLDNISTKGLEINETVLGGSLSLGNYSDASTRLFPPRVTIDEVQVSMCWLLTSLLGQATHFISYFILCRDLPLTLKLMYQTKASSVWSHDSLST